MTEARAYRRMTDSLSSIFSFPTNIQTLDTNLSLNPSMINLVITFLANFCMRTTGTHIMSSSLR